MNLSHRLTLYAVSYLPWLGPVRERNNRTLPNDATPDGTRYFSLPVCLASDCFY